MGESSVSICEVRNAMTAPKEAAATVARVEEAAYVCAGASWVRRRRPAHSPRSSDLFGVIVTLCPAKLGPQHSFFWIIHSESEVYSKRYELMNAVAAQPWAYHILDTYIICTGTDYQELVRSYPAYSLLVSSHLQLLKEISLSVLSPYPT